MSDRLKNSDDLLPQFDAIRNGLLTATGFDIGHYKPAQMMRLLTTIMGKAGAKDFPNYLHLLRLNPKLIQEFKKSITINVSEFLRDPHLFAFLDQTVVPELLKKFPKLQVWSAGCAGGEEPYSVAILMEERQKKHRFDYQILATDIDEQVLGEAKFGAYTDKALKNVPQELRGAYFDQVKENFQVKARLKSRIQFEPHNLLAPMGEGRTFHLILCRNVVIYFSEKAKSEVYKNLAAALTPGGVLFIGATENLLNYREFGLEKVETYFYRKLPVKGNA